jgi:nucleoside-diphosphate-sugar epimerase
MKKVLVTGGNGFLGQGLIVPFVGKYSLRLMDITPFTSAAHEVVVGDVADLSAVQQAVQGVDAIVIAHMVSRTQDHHVYDAPALPFDVNVKGTANLFHAAMKNNIKKVVLVSSSGTTYGYTDRKFFEHDLAPRSRNIYGLTKVCQEVIAEQFQREHGMQVAALRVGCIIDGDKMEDKYGKKFKYFGESLIDRRDIGLAARLALELPDLGYETFYVMGTDQSHAHYDIAYTRQRLGWKPQFDFTSLPIDPAPPPPRHRH